jgi:hypothetical protein
VEQLQPALEPYRHYDPVGWVGAYRFLPLWASFLGLALGGLMMFFGGRRLFRVVAIPLGGLLAATWAAQLATRLGFNAQARQISQASTYILALTGLAFPVVVIFFAVGVPLGLFVGQLVGNADWLLGFAPAFTIGGTIGVIAHRFIGALLSSMVGAWLLTLSALSLLGLASPSSSNWLAAHPIVVLCAAAALSIGGTSYQLLVRLPPGVAREKKELAAKEKKRAKEQKILDERWIKHNGRK